MTCFLILKKGFGEVEKTVCSGCDWCFACNWMAMDAEAENSARACSGAGGRTRSGARGGGKSDGLE